MIYRPDFYNLKIRKKQLKKLRTELTLVNMLLPKNSNISTSHKSRMVWNKKDNLQTRLTQLTHQKNVWIGKNGTNWNLHKWQYWKVFNINLCLSFCTSPKSKTHFIQLIINKMRLKKWLEQFTDHMKKAKKLLENWNWNLHKWQY